jgi:hypothetical protein
MKLDKDPFRTNMNMVELDGKKVLVWPSQAESTKGKEVVIGEEWPPRMIKPKSLKDGQWQKNEGSKPQRRLKATFNILMAKYKEGRAGIRGRENWTIRNTKLDSSVYLGQASTSVTGGSFGKQSRTPPWQNSEGLDDVNKIIIWCLTFQSGHQCLGRVGLRRWYIHLVLLGWGGMDRGLRRQCTSI